MNQIIISQPYQKQETQKIISIEQYQKKRLQRRRRVAKRQLKRFPLFAVEFMQNEFPAYDIDTFIGDVTRPTRNGKKRKSKSPLKRQGRFPLMEKNLALYSQTKDVKYLREEQRLRNNMFKPFEVVFRLGKETKEITLQSETSLGLIQSLVAIKFQNFDELEEVLKEKLKYSHVG